MNDRRLSHEADDHHAVVDVVRESGVYRVLSVLLSAVSRAAQTSRCVAATRGAREMWTVAAMAERVRAIAVMLATASLVHLIVNASFGDPAGRFWLAIPVATLLGSGVLLIFSRRTGTTRSTF